MYMRDVWPGRSTSKGKVGTRGVQVLKCQDMAKVQPDFNTLTSKGKTSLCQPRKKPKPPWISLTFIWRENNAITFYFLSHPAPHYTRQLWHHSRPLKYFKNGFYIWDLLSKMFQIKSFSHFFLTPSRFLQESILINVAKDIFSAHTTLTGEVLWRKFLETPRRGIPVLPGRLFSTRIERCVSSGTSQTVDL